MKTFEDGVRAALACVVERYETARERYLEDCDVAPRSYGCGHDAGEVWALEHMIEDLEEEFPFLKGPNQ